MIVPMKKAQIVVLKEDKDLILKNLQKRQVLMLVSSSEEELHYDTSFEETNLKKTEDSLRIIKKFRDKPGFVRQEFVVDYEEFSKDSLENLELLANIEEANNEILKLTSEIATLKSEIAYYKPWETLGYELDSLDSSKYARVHLGEIRNQNLNKFEDVINSFGADYNLVTASASHSRVIYACYVEDDNELSNQLKALDYQEVKLPEVSMNPEDIILEKQTKIESNLLLISQLEDKLKTYSEKANDILVLEDKLLSDKDLKSVPTKETYSAVYLVGWVRSDQADRLKDTLDRSKIIYDLALTDPSEDDVIPTATKNGKFASVFEPLTNMFSVPSVNDVDPNPVMGFWYWLIFGMMMGDAGYGAVLSLLMFILIKLTKPKGNTYKMYKMFFYGGFATMLWGALFSSYFGFALYEPVINPQVDIMEFMILSLAIGAFHLISGYLIKAYGDIKNGRILDAIFDNFAWVFLIIGLGMMFVPSLNKIGMIVALVGAALIVLTHGRKNKNIFAKLGGGLYSLYNSVGVFSDILSYSRILALSLSSAIIGYVMNILAGLLHGSVVGYIFAALIYIIGHAFNLVMGLLSAYVHDSRLQYIEFFGKFYEGGGVEFKPLALNLKNIDKIEKVQI